MKKLFIVALLALVCALSLPAIAETIVSKQPVLLTEASPKMRTSKVEVGRLTDTLTLRLRRPTTLQPLAWDATSTLRTTVVLVVDGEEYPCVGRVTGGIRFDSKGNEMPQYFLISHPTVVFRDGSFKRIGETGQATFAYVILERLSGTIQTELTFSITESPAPSWPIHSSVAFQDATDAEELGGDGVLSLTHTSTGSNLAVFAGSSNSEFANGSLSTSITYNAVGMTEEWDFVSIGNSSLGIAGYSLAGPDTGPQTVISTLVNTSPSEHDLGVISMTGVDQSTPTGTAFTSPLDGVTSISVTVTDAANDDLICDLLYVDGVIVITIGADQTLRNTEDPQNGLAFRQSTQPGSDNDVMSWSWTGNHEVNLGAIAFKAVAGGGVVITGPIVVTGPVIVQ